MEERTDQSKSMIGRLMLGGWLAIAVGLAATAPLWGDYRSPNWVMDLPTYGLLAGSVLPIVAVPLGKLLDRRRQRLVSEMLENALVGGATRIGVGLEVKPHGLRGVQIRMSSLGIPGALSLRNEVRAGTDIRTGDPDLDPVVRLRGDEEVALAILDPETRSRLRMFYGLEPDLRLGDGTLSLVLAAGAPRAALTGAGKAMLELARGLSLAQERIPEELAARALTDPLESVRHRALEVLMVHRPSSKEARQIAEEILSGDDPTRGLIVARALEDAAAVSRFEAMLAGARGRLAVTSDPAAAGGLSQAREAGALSEAEPAAPRPPRQTVKR